MEKAIVVINEQHTLMADQELALNKKFDSFELLKVPAQGWTLSEMQEISDKLVSAVENEYYDDRSLSVVFASPIPYMMKLMFTSMSVVLCAEYHIMVFHNDNREKKELPNGKIIFTVADKGWVIV